MAHSDSGKCETEISVLVIMYIPINNVGQSVFNTNSDGIQYTYCCYSNQGHVC